MVGGINAPATSNARVYIIINFVLDLRKLCFLSKHVLFSFYCLFCLICRFCKVASLMCDSLFWQPATLSFFVARCITVCVVLWQIKFSLSLSLSCPSNVATVYLFIMSSMISLCLFSMNLTGYVQCILCVECGHCSLVDILVHQSGTLFVLLYFDCCIDCFVFLVCLSVCLYTLLCE